MKLEISFEIIIKYKFIFYKNNNISINMATARTNIMQQLKNGTFNQMELYDIIDDLEACLRTYISKNPGEIYLVKHDSSLYISNEKFSNDYRFDEIPHISFHKRNINYPGRHPVHIKLNGKKIPLLINTSLKIIYAKIVTPEIQKEIKDSGMKYVIDILNKNLLCIENFYENFHKQKPEQVKLDISPANIKKITNKFINKVKNAVNKISELGNINSATSNVTSATTARNYAKRKLNNAHLDWDSFENSVEYKEWSAAETHLNKITEATEKLKKIMSADSLSTIFTLKKIKRIIFTQHKSPNQTALTYVDCAIHTIEQIRQIKKVENFNFNTFSTFCNKVNSDSGGGGASKGGRR